MSAAAWKMKGRGEICLSSLTSCCSNGFENEEVRKLYKAYTCGCAYVQTSVSLNLQKIIHLYTFHHPFACSGVKDAPEEVAPLRDDLQSSLTPCARCGLQITGDGTKNRRFRLRTKNKERFRWLFMFVGFPAKIRCHSHKGNKEQGCCYLGIC